MRGRSAASTLFALLLSGVVIATIVSILVPPATTVAGGLAIAAAVVGLVVASRTQRMIAGILLAIGCACLGLALVLGARPTVVELLSVNQDVIAMLAAVSFIGLLARDDSPPTPRLRGAPAVWRTGALIHLIGSVINMSAVTIVGDYLRRDGTLRPADAVLVSRSFASAAMWTPFWAATATAFALVPGANVPVLLLVGSMLAAASVSGSMATVFRSLGAQTPDYRGYPLDWSLLRIPLALVGTVVVVHLLVPAAPVTRVVALSAVMVTGIALLVQHAPTALRRFAKQARDGLPNLRGEVALFTSAGVLALGVGALLRLFDLTLPLDAYTVPVAWLCTVAVILVSLVGVHPVISAGLIAALVAPLDPSPTLFALSITAGWGAAVTVGPLSGLQLYLNGRYGVDGFAMTRRNLPYVAVVLVLEWPALYAASLLAG